MLSGEATNTNFIVFGLTRPGLNQRSTTLEESMLTMISSQIGLKMKVKSAPKNKNKKRINK
jgi:hypothetical protein